MLTRYHSTMNKLLAALVVALVATWSGAAESSVPDSGRELADNVVKALSAGPFTSATRYVYFPDAEGSAERKANEAGVGDLLAIAQEEFGTVSGEKYAAQPLPDFADTEIGGGTIPFWAANPKFRRYAYAVNFAKRGAGWIYVDVALVKKSEQYAP
jgi:hypothetical protein